METENDKLAKQVSQNGPLYNVAPVANYSKQYKHVDVKPKNVKQSTSTVNPFK